MGDYGPHNGERFDDEDSRPTSKKELWGWYTYGFAAEQFVIVGVASFIPITLEQLARENGVLLKDRTTPCRAAWAPPPTTGVNATDTILHAYKNRELPACVINLFGLEINTASFAMYTFSLSVLVQALVIISMSGAADHGRFRKTFLLVFAFIGSIATMLFITVVPSIYLLGAVFAIISNTCFGASFVLLNSFLPLIVRYHPSILREQENSRMHESDQAYEDDPDETIVNSTSSLLPSDQPDQTLPGRPIPAAVSPELKLSTRISSYGIGIGYTAGLVVQCVCILLVVATGSTTLSLRLALLIAGAWWFLFTIPAALWLRPRPGPPLPTTAGTSWYSYITYAWKSLFRTISHARKLRDLIIFLAAWFLLSDSIATVSGTAVLFAKTTLGMPTASLGLINVIATIFGVLGAFTWSFISSTFSLSASQTIIACITLFELIPLYGLLGFIPAIRRLGVLGLQQPWEMYPLGAIYGFVLGGLSSYCRAFFAELIPPGFEAAFYALYAITDKGSSVFGPAIVGAITDRYGEIRPAFVFLAVLIGAPLPLLWLLDVKRGKRDARDMVAALEGVEEYGGQAGDRGYGSIPRIEVEAEDDE